MYETDKIAEYAKLGADYIRLWEHWLSEENIDAVRKNGKKLWIMTGKYETVGYPMTDNIFEWEKLDVDAVLVNNVCDFIK